MLLRNILTTDSSISLSFFPAYNQNFITPFQGARCVHGFSVGVARPFAFWDQDGQRQPVLEVELLFDRSEITESVVIAAGGEHNVIQVQRSKNSVGN